MTWPIMLATERARVASSIIAQAYCASNILTRRRNRAHFLPSMRMSPGKMRKPRKGIPWVAGTMRTTSSLRSRRNQPQAQRFLQCSGLTARLPHGFLANFAHDGGDGLVGLEVPCENMGRGSQHTVPKEAREILP